MNRDHAAKAKVTFASDTTYLVRYADYGAAGTVSVLATNDPAIKAEWVKDARAAGLVVISETHLNADPEHPDAALVATLAKRWIHQPVLTPTDHEICVGCVGPEPTKFMYEVSSYLHRTDSGKARQFDKKFMQANP